MATAPFQLWVDIPSISAISRAGTTVTVNTSSANSLVTGQYVQIEGYTSTGTALNGVYQATVTNGTTFTYSTTTTGTLSVTGTALLPGVASQDLLNPLVNYGTASRQAALYVDLESMSMSSTGDGTSSSMSFQVHQDQTPAAGPWFNLIPDQARVRLSKTNTATAPADGDLYFIGTIALVSGEVTDSGQGTHTTVNVEEVNAILDRLVVTGSTITAQPPLWDGGGFIRTAGSVVTVTTDRDHGFFVGGTISVRGVINTFASGNFNTTSTTIATVPSASTFTYISTGTNGTADLYFTPNAIAWQGSSLQNLKITFTNPHGLTSGDSVTLQNFNGTTANCTGLLNNMFTDSNMKVLTTTTIQITLASPVTNQQTISKGQVKGSPRIVPLGSGTAQQNFSVIGGVSEDSAAQKALAVIHNNKSKDYALQRILSTSTTTKIVGAGSTITNATGVTIPAGSLRAVLDSIVEVYGGQDKLKRRYWIDLSRRLNYALVDDASKPTYANAPYKIITSGTQNPDTTTAAATVIPQTLNMSYDHNTTKSALFNISSDAAGANPVAKVINYTDMGYTTRPGAPILDDVVSYPTASSSPDVAIKRSATSFFLERSVPLLTGTFVLRGAATAAWNQNGYSAGYYQTGASSWALQSRWEPGQWVDITCSQLGLSGLYRIEQVNWSLERGSFMQIITVTFNRKNPNLLSAQMSKRSK